MSRKTSESRASRAAEMLRGSRRINDSTIRRIAEKTGLPDTIITEIAKPIRQARAEQEAIDSAERALAAAERRVRREQAHARSATPVTHIRSTSIRSFA